MHERGGQANRRIRPGSYEHFRGQPTRELLAMLEGVHGELRTAVNPERARLEIISGYIADILRERETKSTLGRRALQTTPVLS